MGSGTGAFSLFRCLKLAPAERCCHVRERRQSAPALVSAFRGRMRRCLGISGPDTARRVRRMRRLVGRELQWEAGRAPTRRRRGRVSGDLGRRRRLGSPLGLLSLARCCRFPNHSRDPPPRLPGDLPTTFSMSTLVDFLTGETCIPCTNNRRSSSSPHQIESL